MPVEHFDYGTMITGNSIQIYHLLTQKTALMLEIAGKGKIGFRRSVSNHLKKTYGWHGNKQKILAKLEEEIIKQKELLGE